MMGAVQRKVSGKNMEGVGVGREGGGGKLSSLPSYFLSIFSLLFVKFLAFCNDPKILVNSKYHSKEPIYIY